MRLPGLWRARMAVGVPTMVLAAVLVAAAAPAGAASAGESRLLALTNHLRASVGAPAVSFDESLAAVAAPVTTTTGPPPTGAPPSAGPPSPWLALALEVTRGWERATG